MVPGRGLLRVSFDRRRFKPRQLMTSVFLAAPLRRQVIVKEKLVFPSGSTLESDARESTHTQLRPLSSLRFCTRSRLHHSRPDQHQEAPHTREYADRPVLYRLTVVRPPRQTSTLDPAERRAEM